MMATIKRASRDPGPWVHFLAIWHQGARRSACSEVHPRGAAGTAVTIGHRTCGVTPRKIATALPRLEFPTGLHCFPHCPNIMVNWLSVGIAGGTKEYYKVFIKTPSEFKFPSINFELHIPLEIEFREKELILSVYKY